MNTGPTRSPPLRVWFQALGFDVRSVELLPKLSGDPKRDAWQYTVTITKWPAPRDEDDFPTPQHLALHLAKDAGALAAACEKLDHEDEVDEGTRALLAWYGKNLPNVLKTLMLLDEHRLELEEDRRAEVKL